MPGDYIAFGSLVLNGAGAAGSTGATYTVERAEGLGSLPTPRIVITELAGSPGAVLSEADDDIRTVVLEGEIHTPSHEIMEAELSRFKYLVSVQRDTQYLYWTPRNGTARKITAILQNNAAVTLDMEDDTTAVFRLELLCMSPYWCSTTDTITSGTITGTGETISLTNRGDAYSEPVIRIKPTHAKAGGFVCKRWVALWNCASSALSDYPTEITSQSGVSGLDHAALIIAGKAQADGDDLRVEVNGVQVNRWLDSPNTNHCKVWVNLTLQAGQSATLSTAFASGDTLSSLTVDDVSGFPSSGILYNTASGEAFTYTGRDDVLNRFTGVTRAAKGTTAGSGTTSDTIVWIEHDIWLLYGNASIGAPSVDDNYKPAFELDHSGNTSWVYEQFGEDDGLRTGAWKTYPFEWRAREYTANHAGTANPWTEVGIITDSEVHVAQEAIYYLHNPVGITAAAFSNCEKYSLFKSRFYEMAYVFSQLDWIGETTVLYYIPAPSADNAWQSWSWSGAVSSGKTIVGLYVGTPVGDMHAAEVDDCTLTLNSSNTPGIVLGAEQGNYDLDAMLTIVEGGEDQEAIRLQLTMDLDQQLEVDCINRTVTYLKDDANQFQALTLQSPSLRNYWIRLPGHWNGGKTISLRYDETGVVRVEIVVTFPDRYL